MFGKGVRAVPLNPQRYFKKKMDIFKFPIYELTRNSIPYLRPDF